MKKDLPKRKDLRRQIAKLKRENAALRYAPITPAPVTASYVKMPERLTIAVQIRKAVTFDVARSQNCTAYNRIYRKIAIEDLAKLLARNLIEQHMTDITIESAGPFDDVIRMTVEIIPYKSEYPEEIREALEEQA